MSLYLIYYSIMFVFLGSLGGKYCYLAESSAATIRAGDKLNSTSQLVSENGNFTLGFFTIGPKKFSYFGIWYTYDKQARKVWVANRNAPVIGSSHVLTIDKTGNLAIIREGRNVVNISSDQVLHTAGSNNNISATLQDNGNFVLVADEPEHRILWQSFDYPTDVLLPEMKVGYNLAAAVKEWTLNSWLSDQDPASGAFSLSWELVNDFDQLVIRRRGEIYWTSGKLIPDKQTFQFLTMLNNPLNLYSYNLRIIDDAEAMYITYNSIDGKFPMWILNPNGEVYDVDNTCRMTPTVFCRGHDEYSDGCLTNFSSPVCRNRNDKLEERNADFIGGTTSVYDDSPTQSLSDCMQRCWNDCSCVGFANNSNGTGCIMYSGAEYTINDRRGATSIYVFVSAGETSKAKGNKWVWIVISVVISLVLLMSALLCFLRMRKIRLQEEEEKKRHECLQELIFGNFSDPNEIGGDKGEGNNDLHIYNFGSIAASTNDFSDDNKLGEGGFGPVYKGKLVDGSEIAIKRLAKTSEQGFVEFKNELILIAKLQHRNLVRVLGSCIHGEEKMLIYEYMSNKSLDYFLFDEHKRDLLDWQKRVNIIEGIGQGLLYLHKHSRMRVIHRDLKASNVLLDENMNPKISDFGMAKIFKQNETHANTLRVVGTYGYMSPEYAMEGIISVKSDVFSFGVLVLEIVCGRRNNSFYNIDRPLNLIGYTYELWKGGRVLDFKDPTLIMTAGSYVVKQLSRTVHIALLCVQECAEDRPDMSYVISVLGNESIPLPVPKQPAFCTGRSVTDLASSESNLNDISVNGLTITVMESR